MKIEFLSEQQRQAVSETRHWLAEKNVEWTEEQREDGSIHLRWPGPIHDYLCKISTDGKVLHY